MRINLRGLLAAAILMSFPVILWLSANAFIMEYFTVKSRLSNIIVQESTPTEFQTIPLRKRYLSLSLYGDDEFFTLGTIRNVELANYIYPGWIVRVYVNSSVPLRIINAIKEAGAEVIDMSREERLNEIDGRFWRFLVADERDLDVFVSRDVDSRISVREKCAVDEWISSNKTLHCMRDHPMHGQPIMAGMFGMTSQWKVQIFGSAAQNKTMRQLINEFKMRGKKGDDQIFLKEVIWAPISAQRDFVAHDSFTCMDHRFIQGTSFPCPRLSGQYVGQKAKGYHDKPSTSLRVSSAPLECRRKPEWQYG